MPTLADLGAANQKLAESEEFGDWMDAHDHRFDGRGEDVVTQIVNGAPDPDRPVSIVAGTRAVAANGKLGSALAAGVELAETFVRARWRDHLGVGGEPLVCAALCTRDMAPGSDCLQFPYAGEVIGLAPDTYTLRLWLAETPMAPYARWLPASSVGLEGCTLTIDTTGQDAPTLTVTGFTPATNQDPCLTA